MLVLALVVLAGTVLYFMTPEERRRLFYGVARALPTNGDVKRIWRAASPVPLVAGPEARIPWPLVTLTLGAVNLAVFIAMLWNPVSHDTSASLIAWGGNFGPRTTAGEQWRVFASIFVHRGAIHLLVNVTVLLQLGLILERMVGPFTFGMVFVTAGVLGSIIGGAASPMTVVAGSTGAVCGVYGLLMAAAFRGVLPGATARLPWTALKSLAPLTVAFVLYCQVSEAPYTVAKVGLCTGVIAGTVLTRSVRDCAARLRRFAVLGAATATIVFMSAMALRAVTDVRADLAAVVATEARTAAGYDAAVAQFRKGRTSAKELAQIIERTIRPELQRAHDRVNALTDVPAVDAPMVRAAQEYLRLRDESWRTRAEALRSANMRRLRDADAVERAALNTLQRLTGAVAAS